jgi:hypothetical protein
VSQRLFIVWSHPLLCRLVTLLLDDPELVIVGAASDYGVALEQLNSLQPDVIVVEETQDNTVTAIEPIDILKACLWGPCVIRLSLQDNELRVYHQKQWIIGSREDFLHVVRDTRLSQGGNA